MSVARPRWLIIADSLALPRPGLAYEATWPYRLQRRYLDSDWVALARRGSTSERLITDGDGGGDTLEFYQPDGVVLQIGICDCAPRLFGPWTDRVVRRLPTTLANVCIHWKKRCFGRSSTNVLVTPAHFQANLDCYFGRCQKFGVQILMLPIFPPSQVMREKNPSIQVEVDKYNTILEQLAGKYACLTLLSGYALNEASLYTMDDGYHLNELGNEFVFNQIVRALEPPKL